MILSVVVVPTWRDVPRVLVLEAVVLVLVLALDELVTFEELLDCSDVSSLLYLHTKKKGDVVKSSPQKQRYRK